MAYFDPRYGTVGDLANKDLHRKIHDASIYFCYCWMLTKDAYVRASISLSQGKASTPKLQLAIASGCMLLYSARVEVDLKVWDNFFYITRKLFNPENAIGNWLIL